jgi:uncharacterized membrane protein
MKKNKKSFFDGMTEYQKRTIFFVMSLMMLITAIVFFIIGYYKSFKFAILASLLIINPLGQHYFKAKQLERIQDGKTR